MKREKIWINGRMADAGGRAGISVFDRGFMYGDGVFETMRCYAGKVFMADEHIARLYKGAEAIKIKPPMSRNRLGGIIRSVIDANKLKSAYVKVNLTRGEGRLEIGLKAAFKPNIVVTAKEYEGYPEWMYRKGITAGIVKERQCEYSPIAGKKTMNYLAQVLARLAAREDGYDEAILKNAKGDIAEAASSNVFIVSGSRLITPSLQSGILDGITRTVVIGIARGLGIKVAESFVSERQLLAADELFLTNSLAEVIPVTRVNSRKIGSGLPGEITKLLHISYQKKVIKSTL